MNRRWGSCTPLCGCKTYQLKKKKWQNLIKLWRKHKKKRIKNIFTIAFLHASDVYPLAINQSILPFSFHVIRSARLFYLFFAYRYCGFQNNFNHGFLIALQSNYIHKIKHSMKQTHIAIDKKHIYSRKKKRKILSWSDK